MEYIHNFSEFEFEHRGMGYRFNSSYMYIAHQNTDNARLLREMCWGEKLYGYRNKAVHIPNINRGAEDINTLKFKTRLMLDYLKNPLDTHHEFM